MYYRETYSAQNDKGACNYIQKNVVTVGNQTLSAAENIESGVVESGNRMKQADKNRSSRGIITGKRNERQCRAAQFYSHGGYKNAFNQFENVFCRIEIHAFFNYVKPAEVDMSADGKHYACAYYRHAQSAGLNQQHKNCLPEGRKSVSCVGSYKSGNANRAGRSVQRVDIAKVYAFF